MPTRCTPTRSTRRPPGPNLGPVLSADGVVDTITELQALAADIAADFNANASAAFQNDGFTMEVDANGDLCLIGPDDKTGDTPTVVVSAVDGAATDIPATPEVTCIDFGSGGNFLDMGDIFVVDFAGIPYQVAVEDIDGSTPSKMAQLVADAINADATASTQVTATIDPNDDEKLILTAVTPRRNHYLRGHHHNRGGRRCGRRSRCNKCFWP